MKSNRLLLALTIANLALLLYQAAQLQRAHAASDTGILRGRGLEIVDEQGRLRSQLTIVPGDKNYKMPDGKIGYGETVIFRLITADGKPPRETRHVRRRVGPHAPRQFRRYLHNSPGRRYTDLAQAAKQRDD